MDEVQLNLMAEDFFQVMIFEQLFWYNFWDNLIILSSHWSKTMEREKEDYVNMRDKVV